jgi:hypothetical protein
MEIAHGDLPKLPVTVKKIIRLRHSGEPLQSPPQVCGGEGDEMTHNRFMGSMRERFRGNLAPRWRGEISSSRAPSFRGA